MKTSAQNKQSTSFADLIADSELKKETIQIGDHSATVRELTGRERFELTERGDFSDWDTMLWVAFTCLLDPKPATVDKLEEIKMEWVVLITTTVMKISGMEATAIEEAENELVDVNELGGS